VEVDTQKLAELSRQFDIVYDTSGTTEGFVTSLALAKRVVHLKSTNGQSVAGLDYLTEMVVDEIGLLPYSSGNLLFSWFDKVQSGEVQNILVSNSVSDDLADEIAMLRPNATITRCSVFDEREALMAAVTRPRQKCFSQFDVAVVSDLQEVNAVVRPRPELAHSLVRPRGNIVLGADPGIAGNKLFDALTKRHLEIHTSRCGDFSAALEILDNNASLVSTLQKEFITHRFLLKDIDQAFEVASDSSQSVKVIVEI
jgi:threonine dehydrogenase-like Zn-dependent dehydrogenase